MYVRHRTDCHRPPTQHESSVPAQLTHSPPHPGDVTTKKGAPRPTVGTNVCQLGKRVEFRWEQGQTPSGGGGGGGDGAASASAPGKAVRQSSPPLRAPPVSGEAHISCCVSGWTIHWRCASGTGPVGWAGGAAQSNIVAALPSTACLGSWSDHTARHASSPSLAARMLVTNDALPSELMFHCCFCDVVSQGHMMDLVAAAPGGPGPPLATASSIVSPIAAMAEAAYEEEFSESHGRGFGPQSTTSLLAASPQSTGAASSNNRLACRQRG